MEELAAAAVPAALTAVFGIFVCVTGQAIQRFLLEPLQEQPKIIARQRMRCCSTAMYPTNHRDG